jgi:hypothetical protein
MRTTVKDGDNELMSHVSVPRVGVFDLGKFRAPLIERRFYVVSSSWALHFYCRLLLFV